MSADNIPTSEDKPVTLKPPEPPMKCPRCDSPNTKFCYYNNYSLTQPRHFCKTCRRYWTKGGALRNVPIGGGCRKNKRSTKSTSRVSCGDSKDSAASSHSGGFKLFQGLSPAMDFQLGGVGVGGSGELPFSILHSSPVYNTTNNHQFVSLGENLSTAAAATATATINPSSFDIDSAGAASATSGSLMGFNLSSYPVGIGGGDFKSDGGIREMGSMNVHSSLASSIESLSCINQDLHWKLQQQRLATLFGGGASPKGGEGVTTAFPLTVVPETQTQKRDPFSFQNLGISKQEVSAVNNLTTKEKGMSGGTTITDWFFENSYTTPPPTATSNTKNSNSGSNENDNSSNWNGIQAWTDLHQYSELP